MIVKVTFVKVGGVLDEQFDISAGELATLKKRKKRDLRVKYRNCMKDSKRFEQTHMADKKHTSMILSKTAGDQVIFFAADPFVIDIGRDPEIEEDEGSPDYPLLIAPPPGGTKWTIPQSSTPLLAADADFLAGRRVHKAGPYPIDPEASDQAFYKFTAWSDGARLDPDIVVGD
jgi:hypothetical protein